MVEMVQYRPYYAYAIEYDGHNIKEIEDFLGLGAIEIIKDNKIYLINTFGTDNLIVSPGDYIVKDKIGWPRVYDQTSFFYLFQTEPELEDNDEWNPEWNTIPLKYMS